MAEIDGRLADILKDDGRLQQVLDLAQLLRRKEAAEPEARPPARGAEASGPASPPPSAADPQAVFAQQSTPPPAAPGVNFSAMLEVLPQLLDAFSGGNGLLPSQKVNLVEAIRPYAASHGGSFDRAIKMASIAKAAKSAIHALGHRGE